jgi:UrcA family protein
MSHVATIVAPANDRIHAWNRSYRRFIGLVGIWSGSGRPRVLSPRRPCGLNPSHRDGLFRRSPRKETIMSHIAKIAALSVFFALAAHAESPSATVAYGDLDLNKRAGAETMLARLQAGVDRVCGAPGHFTLAQRQQYRRCSKQAMDGALAQLDAPLVTALHGQPQPLSQVAMGK